MWHYIMNETRVGKVAVNGYFFYIKLKNPEFTVLPPPGV